MIAYFDCFSGISGDMVVGALIDAGVPFDWLRDELKKLPLDGYKLEVRDVKRRGIGGKRFRVKVNKDQPERSFSDIKKIIVKSGLSDIVKENSVKVFKRLAEAEGMVHRVKVEKVHFHEVGAVDSIIDIISASLSLSYFGIDKVYASEIPLSRGTVLSSHGRLPLPAPATAELLKDVPVYHSQVDKELVTPTGAAFITALGKRFGKMPSMRLKVVGYGAGERDNEGLPNLLRVMIGDCPGFTGLTQEGGRIGTVPGYEVDSVTVIEANIDDMNPEIYGFVMDRLFDGGALDVSLTPVYMKKGRAGTLIQVISETGREREMANILLQETSTIGVRFYGADRLKLPRETVVVRTRFGKVRMKVARLPKGDKTQPEYDDCRRIAMEKDVPILEVYKAAIKGFERNSHE